MKPVIIIPARLESSRIPRKMLLEISGKPLIRWTVEAAERTGFRVYVATDSKEIARASGCRGALMTGPCLNGTERCLEVARHGLGGAHDLIINWQGDSPMTDPASVVALAEQMRQSAFAVGTLEQWVARDSLGGEVEVLTLGKPAMATNFERVAAGAPLRHRHVGIYAIKQSAWDLYGRAPSQREIYTGLEQMRWLDRGVAIGSFEVPDYPAHEINNDFDVGLFKTALESCNAVD